MRKLIVTMWASLDGFVSGPENAMDWVRVDQAMGSYEYEVVSAADTLLLGRLTYESFAGSWPYVPDNPAASKEEIEYANKLNAMRKIVFSKMLASADWNNSTLAREVVADEIAQLKQQPGKDIIIYGSASIVQQLTNLGLIDEYQISVHPVILGSGKPLFKDIKERMNLKLVQSRALPTGVVQLTYQRA